MKHFNIPIFIPEMACPHQCVFCNQNAISGVYNIPDPSEVSTIIDSYLATMPSNSIVDIAFFGGSFTGIPIELQESYLSVAHRYLKRGDISGIRLSTRPDYIDTERIATLKKYGVTTVELGAQSFHPEVLAKSGRGHTDVDIRNASKMIIESGIELGLQMMVGLPGDTLERAINTAEEIIKCGATNCRIYPTLVIKGTALHKLYSSGSYTALTLEEAVNWVKEIYPIFEQAGITILRTGLHPSEEFSDNRSLVAGPYHPSFKELVLSAIWRDRFTTELPAPPSKERERERERERGVAKSGKLVISVSYEEINFAIGHGGTNRAWLKERYGWIKIKPNHKLKGSEFHADYY